MVSRRAAPLSYRSEEHTSELQSRGHLVCRLLLEKKKTILVLNPHIKKKRESRIDARNTIYEILMVVDNFFFILILITFSFFFFFFFFNDTATTEIYTLSLHDALPT